MGHEEFMHMNYLFGLALMAIFISVVVNFFTTPISLLVAATLILLIFKEVITPEFPEIDKWDAESDLYEDYHNY